jgi:SH3-like domain-containing protein
MHGQGEAQRARASIVGAALFAAIALGLVGPAAGAPAERQTPSGFPVPRYISLKFGEVNARAGPGSDYKLLWVYRAKGLPVQVVAETSEWRRICDPEGKMVWVHKRTTTGRRTVINTRPGLVALLRRPKPGAKVKAYLRSHAMADLVRCEKGWCKVKVAGGSGWSREGVLWGTLEAPQCR